MKEEDKLDKLVLVGLALLVVPALLKRATEAKPTPAPPGTGGPPPPDMVREVMTVYPAPHPPDAFVPLPTEIVVITPPIIWEERAGGPVYAPMPVYEPYEGRKPSMIDAVVIVW